MLTDVVKKNIQQAYSRLLDSKGLKARHGQKLMIAEVARTLMSADCDADGKRLDEAPVCVVEAGTGTGKTISYLVPAIPIAKALDKTLVIASATVALQEQIIYKDLPDIRQHSGLDFSFALAKGRGRYLCLSKLDAVMQDNAANNEAMGLYPDELQGKVDTQTLKVYDDMLSALSSGGWEGDRDSWTDEVDDLLWSRVTTDHAQCTGRRCPNISQCCFYQARESLGKVDVVVTNHDLVLADLALGGGAILPDPEEAIYIFDEGHHLPDKAINHFAQFSRIHASQRWLDQGVKVLAKAAPKLGEGAGINRHLQPLPDCMGKLKQQLSMLFQTLEGLVDTEGGSQRNGLPRHRFEQGVVPEAIRDQAQELSSQYRNMADWLDNACDLLEEAMEEVAYPIPRQVAEEWYPALAMLKVRAEANRELWLDYSRASDSQDPPIGRWVAVVEGAGGNLDFDVCSSPIIASKTLQHYLWSRCHAAVVTSATLTALGRFDRFAMRAGTPAGTNYAVVPSPFDFTESGELVVPSMSSEPSDPEAHTEELIDRLPELLKDDLGSLVLFSSRRQMEAVFDGLPQEWQSKIVMQGNYPKHEMLRLHKTAVDKKEQSVLFGLASFAEGVDLPGDYCRHVVIAKIPFSVPDQPVESALAEWIEGRGGNPFMDITVPDAAVRLVQACGRLLRTETDQGKVTLLDRRIVTKRYGSAMLNCLPPFKRSIA
jgi:ATP-dependent DNA helicase DinG